jgi:hypothetical protein
MTEQTLVKVEVEEFIDELEDEALDRADVRVCVNPYCR